MDDDRRSRLPVVLISVLAMFVLALYLGAAGPLNAMMRANYITEGSLAHRSIEIAYWPMVRLMDICRPFAVAMKWYLEWWG